MFIKMKGAVVVVLMVVVAAAAGHDWGWGRCPSAKAVAALDVEKFLGLWYVVQQTDTTSSCLTMNYTRSSPTQLRATKSRQLLVLDSLSIEHVNSYTAKLDIPDFDNAGAMRVKWPLNLAGKADYTVLDTDYDTFAVVFECQKLTGILHRKSTSILSRAPTLSPDLISKARQVVSGLGISTRDLDFIDHGVCVRREDANLNIDIDEETIKQMLRDASQSVKNLAAQAAGGASELASSLADLSRALASNRLGSDVVVIPAGIK